MAFAIPTGVRCYKISPFLKKKKKTYCCLLLFFFRARDYKHFDFECRQEIRTSTSSMTSVPKPLKFLRPHYGTLKAYYETMPDCDLKVLTTNVSYLCSPFSLHAAHFALWTAEVPC